MPGRGAVPITLALLLATLAPDRAHGFWNTEIAAAERVLGPGRIALLPGGTAAMAYGHNGLRYAEGSGPTFAFTQVDDACVFDDVSLALDPAGEPAIAYCVDERELRFAHRESGTFRIQRVEAVSLGCRVPSLAYDAAGRPAIAYEGASGIRFVEFDGTAWRASLAAAGTTRVVQGTSLAFSPTGEPSFAYTEAGDLFLSVTSRVSLATRTGASWSVTLLDENLGDGFSSASLAFNTRDEPAVAYVRRSDTGTDRLLVVEAGVVSDLGLGGGEPSLVREPGGDLVVAFTARGGAITLASRAGATWTPDAIGALSYIPQLAIDAAGNWRVLGFTGSSVELSTRSGAAWSSATVETTTGYIYGASSIAVSGDLPAVSFFANGELDAARFDGNAWSRETVDSLVSSPWGVAMAAGPPPVLGIAYTIYNGPNLCRVRYATWNGATWSATEITPSASSWHIALAFDAAGHPAIAYAGGGVSLARYDGVGWSSSVPVPLVQESGLSLAFDPLGNPALAYADGTSGDLRLAAFDGSAWVDEVVATGISAASPVLAFDPTGRPSIAFGDRVAPAVRFASRSGATWSWDTVYAAPGAWPWTEGIGLVLDARGEPQVSFADDFFVHVARGSAGGWTVEAVAESDSEPSIALDTQGRAYVAYSRDCGGGVVVARDFGDLVVYRKRVLDTAPRWKAAALPLGPDNDDADAPFPLAVVSPGVALDPLPAAAEALVLYHATWADGRDARTFRLAKGPLGTALAF